MFQTKSNHKNAMIRYQPIKLAYIACRDIKYNSLHLFSEAQISENIKYLNYDHDIFAYNNTVNMELCTVTSVNQGLLREGNDIYRQMVFIFRLNHSILSKTMVNKTKLLLQGYL
jgi:hypothetical protein